MVYAPEGVTWDTAAAGAEALGGYLATPKTKAENDFIYDFVKDDSLAWVGRASAGYFGPWLGGFQPADAAEPDQGWMWIDNEPFTYSNWLPGTPSNWPFDSDVLVFFGIGFEPSSFWIDSEVNAYPVSYIVEFESLLEYSYDVEAIDPDNDELAFHLDSAPSGMTIDPSTGLIQWRVSESFADPVDVTVAASDGRGGIDRQSFAIRVDTEVGTINGKKFSDANRDGITSSEIEFSDGDFLPEDWSVQVTNWAPGQPISTSELVRMETGGTPDAYNQQSHRMQDGEFLWTSHKNLVNSYDPSTQGPIDSIDFSIDLTHLTVDFTGFFLLLEQNGKRYYTESQTFTSYNAWETYTLDGLKADDFDGTLTLDSTPSGVLPDFSENGGPITFGYGLENWRNFAGIRTSVTGVDNWTVKVNQQDQGLSSWRIYLDDNDNGTWESDETSTFTNDVGEYTFSGLPPQTYIVREELYPGWEQVFPSAGPGANGSHTVQLFAGDNVFGIDFANVELDSTNANPEILSVPDTDAVVGELYRYDTIAHDPDYDALTYELADAPDGMTVHPHLGVVAWVPTDQQLGQHRFMLLARDGEGGTGLQVFDIEVTALNSPPVFTSVPITTARVSLEFESKLLAQDADGDLLTFELTSGPNGIQIEESAQFSIDGIQIGSTYSLVWAPVLADVGSHPVIVTVDDGRGGTAEQMFTLDVIDSSVNLPPDIGSVPPLRAGIGRSYVYRVDASDPDSDPLTYDLATAPTGMTIDGDGYLSWTPEPIQIGQNDVRIVVEDGNGGSAEQEFQVDVFSQLFNEVPRITSAPNIIALLGQGYEYDVAGEDANGDPLTFELLDGPRGMSVDPIRGRVRWAPDEQQLGTHAVSVRVSDPELAEATQTFEIDVRCTNAHPVIVSVPPTRAIVGQLYTYPVRAEGLDGDQLEFLLSNAPSGLTIDDDGLIRWLPAASDIGSHDVAVGVLDEFSAGSEQSYQLVVVAANDPVDPNDPNSPTFGNSTPVINSKPVFYGIVDEPYQYDVTASDPDGQPIMFTLLSSPGGMSIGSTSGMLTWNPDLSDLGSHPVTIEVSDTENAKATQSYVLTVTENQSPQILSIPVDSVIAGSKYQYAVAADDADGDTLDYSLAGGPTGMLLDRLGRIMWQTDVAEASSQHLVEIEVRDGRGGSDSQVFTLDVLPDGIPPSVSIAVFEGAFPQFTERLRVDVGTRLGVVTTATDNVGVEFLELTLDGVPQPLSSIGVTRFDTSSVGTFEVVANAIDAAGNIGQATLFVDVVAPGTTNPPVPTDPALPPNPGMDPSDNQHPLVEISSPEPATTISDVVSIIGTVDDPEDNLWYYRVFSGRADRVSVTALDMSDPDWVLLHEGTEEVIDGELAVFDPSTVSNDPYVIAVAAYDANGQGYIQPTVLYVEGNILVDNFRLEFTDLSIPLVGVPIEVTRVYDTANAQDEGDFGYGWMFGVQDARILEVASVGQGGAFSGGNDKFVPDNTKVYLTNPAGQRVGFTYKEELISASFFGGVWRPYFEADPGIYDTLAIDEMEVARGGIIGSLAQGINPNAYTLTTKDGLEYRYSEVDGLQTITDLNGNVVTFSDDGIAHSSGEEIAFVRDHRGRIKEIVDPAGNKIDYEYNAVGDLVGVTNQANLETRYEYLADPAHYLDQAFDSLGNRVLKAVYEEDAESGQFKFKGVVDAAGNRIDDRVFDTDARTGIIRDGNGNATTLIYDERGNVLEEIDALGNKTIREYGDPQNPDLETRIVDREGNITDREYDSLGNLIRITELGPAGTPLAVPVTTEFTYDAGNRVTSITNGLGAVTVLGYDGIGNLTRITNVYGHSSSFTYDGQGRRQSFTDFNGNTTTFEYDASCPCGSPSRVVFADGTYQVFAYNQFGQVTLEEFYEADDTIAERRETKYDNIGRVTEEVSGTPGDPNHPQTIVRSIYDGHLLDWEIIVHPDSLDVDGSLLESPATLVANRKSRITEFEYDERDQLIRQIDAEGGVVEFRYDAAGNRILLQDPVGNITTWVYDELNRVSEERDPFFNEGLDIEQASTELEVDSGADCETDTGAAHVRLSCYDNEGNQAKTIDRNGRRREFDYDHAGRLLTESWFAAGSGALVETISFGYDALGNILTATDSNSNYLFTYDALNRLESVDNNPDGSFPSPRVVLDYRYDAQGNVIQSSDDSGVTVGSTYNARNQLATRSWFDADPGGDVDDARVDFLYSAAGREQEVRRYSDLNANTLIGRTVRTYDTAGRSNLLNHVNAADELLAGYDYDYDFSGLLLHEARTHQDSQYAQTIDYLYDLTGQLTGADFDTQDDESFVYDANGHRVTSTLGSDTRNYTTDTGNQLKSDGVYRYEYDGEGNQVKRVHLTAGETRTFIYDHRNRLVRVDDWSGDPGDPNNPNAGVVLTQIVEYAYDSLGRRIARSVDADGEGLQPAAKEYRVYDGENTWADVDSGGVVSARYLFRTETDSNLARFRADMGHSWYLTDRLGSVRDVQAGTGELSKHHVMGSFGAPHNAMLAFDRFLFTGREFDESTGDYSYRTREFSPQLGRFAAIDSLGFDGNDANLYRYIGNSPLNGIDPSGQTAILSHAGVNASLNGPPMAIVGFFSGFSYATFTYLGAYLETKSAEQAIGRLANDLSRLLVVSWSLSTVQFGASIPNIGLISKPLGIGGVFLNGFSPEKHIASAMLNLLEADLALVLRSAQGTYEFAQGPQDPFPKKREDSIGGFINGVRSVLRLICPC